MTAKKKHCGMCGGFGPRAAGTKCAGCGRKSLKREPPYRVPHAGIQRFISRLAKLQVEADRLGLHATARKLASGPIQKVGYEYADLIEKEDAARRK